MQKLNLLAIDVGNTSVQFGYFEGSRLVKTFRLMGKDVRKKSIAALQKQFPVKKIHRVAIASVVPSTGQFLKKSIKNAFGLETFLIGQDLPVPIVNCYKNPKQVGVDRLLNALAAYKKYKRACIVVDFGTAITFDVVSKKGEYLGGVIAPGIEISIDALAQRTALLPKIDLKHTPNIIGRDTVESIRVGCSYGIGGLCDRVVEVIKKKHHLEPVIVATGGYASFISRYTSYAGKLEPSLVLEGIRLTASQPQKILDT